MTYQAIVPLEGTRDCCDPECEAQLVCTCLIAHWPVGLAVYPDNVPVPFVAGAPPDMSRGYLTERRSDTPSGSAP